LVFASVMGLTDVPLALVLFLQGLSLVRCEMRKLAMTELGQKRAFGAPQWRFRWSPNTGHHAALG